METSVCLRMNRVLLSYLSEGHTKSRSDSLVERTVPVNSARLLLVIGAELCRTGGAISERS